MKIKKIIALTVATLMAFASVANAAFFDDDGWTMTDAYPTTAEVAARTVVVTPSVEAISLTDAVALGITARGKTEDNTDCYKVTYTMSGFGDLYRLCYADGSYSNYVELRLFDVTVTIPTFSAKQFKLVSGSLNGKDFGYSNITKLVWNAGTVDACYPTATPEEGILISDLTLTAEVVYALDEGATVDVTPTISATYNVQTSSGKKATDAVGTSTANLVMAPASTVPVSSVTISGATSATVGDSVALSATVLPGDATDPTVTWTKVSGDGAVSAAGVVTANSAGDIVVKATAGGVDSANYTVTFAAATVAVSSVTISGATSATVGDSVALTATVLPGDATDPSVTWTKVSGDGAVSAAGVVTANSAGDIVVKATAGGVDSANFTVTFAAATIPATGVTINGGAAKAVVGDSVTFTATVDPSASTDPVVWSVTGDGANVENGVVTSTKPGNVTVTATAGTVSDVKTVTFVDAPAAPEVENNYSSPAQIGGYNYITGNAAVAAPDFTNFVYKAWAKDEIGGAKHYFDATINDLLAGKFEGGATYNFILMVKSAAHELVDCGIDALLK